MHQRIGWDGHHLVTGSTDGLGVVLVARSFGLFSILPSFIDTQRRAAARSAEAWTAGGKIYSVTGRRPLDERALGQLHYFHL